MIENSHGQAFVNVYFYDKAAGLYIPRGISDSYNLTAFSIYMSNVEEAVKGALKQYCVDQGYTITEDPRSAKDLTSTHVTCRVCVPD